MVEYAFHTLLLVIRRLFAEFAAKALEKAVATWVSAWKQTVHVIKFCISVPSPSQANSLDFLHAINNKPIQTIWIHEWTLNEFWMRFKRFICFAPLPLCHALHFCAGRAPHWQGIAPSEWILRKWLNDSSASSQLCVFYEFLRSCWTPKTKRREKLMFERFKQVTHIGTTTTIGNVSVFSPSAVVTWECRQPPFFPCFSEFVAPSIWLVGLSHCSTLYDLSRSGSSSMRGLDDPWSMVLLCFCVAMVKTQRRHHSWLLSRWVSWLTTSKKLSRWMHNLWVWLCGNRSLHVQPSRWWFPLRVFLLWVSR